MADFAARTVASVPPKVHGEWDDTQKPITDGRIRSHKALMPSADWRSGRANWWRFQPGHHPGPLPKFDGVFADKLLRSLDRRLIVRAVEIEARLDVAVRSDLIDAVVRQFPSPNVRPEYDGIFALDCEAKTMLRLANVH
jgi:hypothetical protein